MDNVPFVGSHFVIVVWYYTISRTERMAASQKRGMLKAGVENVNHSVTEPTEKAIPLVNNTAKRKEVKEMQKLIITIVDHGKLQVTYSLVIEEREDGSWAYDDGDKEILFPAMMEALQAVSEKCSIIRLNAEGEARLDYVE